MLEPWDPHRVFDRVPVVLAAVGARRCGKSTAITHLVFQMFDRYDLVVAFVGSAACSPCLEAMMKRNPHWDERMFFPQWNQCLVDKLLVQQTDLKKKGVERQVLILMDDVVLTGRDADQLAHMCLRGRHFNISVMMAAVSYTSICKRARRCLDFLLVYSCPMSGDRKILSWEYASNSHRRLRAQPLGREPVRGVRDQPQETEAFQLEGPVAAAGGFQKNKVTGPRKETFTFSRLFFGTSTSCPSNRKVFAFRSY